MHKVDESYAFVCPICGGCVNALFYIDTEEFLSCLEFRCDRCNNLKQYYTPCDAYSYTRDLFYEDSLKFKSRIDGQSDKF